MGNYPCGLFVLRLKSLAGGGVAGLAKEAQQPMLRRTAMVRWIPLGQWSPFWHCAEIEGHAGYITPEHARRIHAATVLEGFEAWVARLGHRSPSPGSLCRLAMAGRIMTALKMRNAIRTSYVIATPGAEIAA